MSGELKCWRICNDRSLKKTVPLMKIKYARFAGRSTENFSRISTPRPGPGGPVFRAGFRACALPRLEETCCGRWTQGPPRRPEQSSPPTRLKSHPPPPPSRSTAPPSISLKFQTQVSSLSSFTVHRAARSSSLVCPSPRYHPRATGLVPVDGRGQGPPMRTRRTDLVHRIAYSWTGWPKDEPFPPEPSDDFLPTLDAAWASDGLRRLAHRWQADLVQFTFEAPGNASPEFVAARAKGRLDHALRGAGWRHSLQRKVAVRSLGENTLEVVLRYIATQLDRADLADPRYAHSLAEAAWEDGAVDLDEPLASGHGRYWYNLHLVAVTGGRWRIGREDFLPKVTAAVRSWSAELSAAGGPGEARPGVHSLAVMPDHVHLAVRGPSAQSPDAIAGALRGALNRAAGCLLFDSRVYAGTFSSYPLAHVRPR